jgi:two-component system, sensor histidine kinase and response regulator
MRTDEPVPILAVDDQPENLLALGAVLADPGLRLIKARSGKEALKHLLDDEYAVILLDAFMPEMDGFDTARAIRSREKTRHTPIIFLTATHPDTTQAKAGYSIGAVDFIHKPLVPEIIRAKVSVFVELFRKTKEIRRQAEELVNYKTQLEQRLVELGKLNEELQCFSEDADEARNQALEASRFKSGFLAEMSHEIRTPMNGILGMVEILLRSGLSDKQREYASLVKEAGRSLLIVINDILDFSKIEAGKLSLERTDFEPVRLVESTAELLAAQAKQKGLSLLTFIDPEIPHIIQGDPGRLRQILTNFVGNAIKFSDHGEVVLRTIVESQDFTCIKVRFSVSDRGIGLTEEEIGQLFQPFVQSEHPTGRKRGGTGLGLSISKRLVELMGGEIGVTSVKDYGSTFWFDVPLEKSSSRSVKQLVSNELTGARILMVGDEPNTCEIVNDYISSWGMRNDTAVNQKDLIPTLTAAAKSDPYQLAIIDLKMTEALNLSRAVRENETLKNIKLILITTFDKPGAGEEAISMGFDAYLTKPMKQSVLLNAITTLIHKSSQPTDTPQAEAQSVHLCLPAPATRNELILLAEDHPINQQVALLLLRDLAFEAHIVENGRELLAALKRAPYSLIFMDCQMPEMDGFETTRQIRKMESLTGKHIPIVAMTAHAIEGSREQCLAAGMDEYMSKPIDPNQLRLVLEKWLPACKPNPSDSDSDGDHLPEATAVRQREYGTFAAIDFATAESRYGSNFNKLVEMFVADAPMQIKNLMEAATAQDVNAVLYCSHSLRGISMTIFALPMSAICAEIEACVPAPNADWQNITALIERLANEFDRVKQTLNEHISRVRSDA